MASFAFLLLACPIVDFISKERPCTNDISTPVQSHSYQLPMAIQAIQAKSGPDNKDGQLARSMAFDNLLS